MTPTPHWLPARRYWQAHLISPEKDWVLSRGSLTAYLINLSQHHFKVQVLHQGWQRPTLDECLTLRMPPGQRAWIREVALVGQGQVWVRARSIIPVHTLSGKGRRLRFLGSRSLGSLLFNGGKRGDMLIHRQLDQGQVRWTRRSCFYYGGQPLLVQEQFLPALFAVASQQQVKP